MNRAVNSKTLLVLTPHSRSPVKILIVANVSFIFFVVETSAYPGGLYSPADHGRRFYGI